MNRDIFKLTAILTGFAALTGCTALGHSEGYSRYGDYHTSMPVSHYLRPAPYQPYYFYSQAYAIETARTRFQHVPQFVYHPQPVTPSRVQLANDITRENGVMVHRPTAPSLRPVPTQTIRHIEITPKPVTVAPEYKTQETYVFEETVRAPAVSLPARPEYVAPQPPEPDPLPAPQSDSMPEFDYESAPTGASGVDISYVKTGGGSDIADWEACETQTGGYVEWTQSGYKVDPAFDNCMRVKGYKPESEAEEDLAGAN